MKAVKTITLSFLVTIAILDPLSAYAEEGGNGHYGPGANASFIDALPGRPGLAIANYFGFYDGSASASKRLPSGGLITGGLDATTYSDTIVALYQTPLEMLGGNYALGVAIPFVWLKAKGEATGPLGNTSAARDSDSSIGDILFYPFMLGWTGLNGDLKSDFRFGIYAPTGDYEKGQLANVGKNFWTFEPAVFVSYMSSRTGLELSAFTGMDFNTENHKTDYQTGTQFHLDLTVAEHLPLLGGVIGIGANGFYYQQITSDSSPFEAFLGDFKGRTVGIGPVLSYITKVWGKDLAAEVKWLPELDVKNRLEGDYLWFKVGMAF